MHKVKQRKILESISSYIPQLILEKIRAKKRYDPFRIMSLSGALLQADASGFTKISEKLSQVGPRGAEELTEIFNRFFDLMLKIIFDHQGDVLKFGGDSLLVFFKGKNGTLKAVITALEMQKRMKYFKSVSTSCGDFPLTLHVGINSGNFHLTGLGTPDHKMELSILGSNVNQTVLCNESAESGEVLITRSCYVKAQNQVEISEKKGDFHKVSSLKGKPKFSAKLTGSTKEAMDPERILNSLVPYLPQGIYKKIRADSYGSFMDSEHRRVSVLFLNLIYPDKLLTNITRKKNEISSILNKYFKAVHEIVVDHGGVITRIDPYSSGDKVLILFGAPVAHEDDEQRATLCALQIKEQLRSMGKKFKYPLRTRIGINTGKAFCGEVGSKIRREYTVMGKDVNLAARLMSRANIGDILVGEKTFRSLSTRFKASKKRIRVKGISKPVIAFQVEDLKKQKLTSFQEVRNEEKKTPLIGREKELTQIKGIISKVQTQKGQIISIVGEAGIGKSRLTEKLLELCLEKDMDGFSINCQAYGSSTPMFPWMEILKNHCGILETDGSSKKEGRLTDALQKLDSGRWTPLFNNLLGLSISENEWTRSLDGKARKGILFDTIIRLLISWAQKKGIYLILEDIHWIDQTSLELLQFLSKKISENRILLVLVYRPDSKLKDLEKIENQNKINLSELNKEYSFQLASKHLQVSEIPDQIGKLIWEKSRGNPFYLEELIHSFLDSGYLLWNGDKQGYELRCDPEKLEIPENVQDVIMARIDKLDEMGRKVLKTASVIGRFFSCDTLLSIFPQRISQDKLKYWLEYLDKLDLIPMKPIAPDPQYMFKHTLTQDVAYDLLPFAQRKKLHLKIGDHYEKKFINSLEEKYELLAHHYEKSSNSNKALVYLIKSGNKAKKGHSNQEAIRFFNKAERIHRQDISISREKSDKRQATGLLSELLKHRGEVFELIGDYAQAEKDFFSMLELSKRTKNRSNGVKALNHLAELNWLRADYSASQSYAEKARRISFSIKDNLGLAMSFSNFGDIHRRQGSFDKASKCYQSSLNYFKKIKDNNGIAQSYNNIGICYWSQGCLSEASSSFEKALKVRKENGDKVGEAKTLNNLALVYQDRGNLQESLQMFSNAIEIFKKIGDRRNSGYCLGNMGTIYYSQAQFSKALRAFQDSILIFSDIGDQHALTYSIGNIGDVKFKMGNQNEARKSYQKVLSSARELGDEELESETYSRFGEYHLHQKDLKETEKYFKKALSLAEKIKSNEFIMKALAGLAELQIELTQSQQALKTSNRLLKMAQQENTRGYTARGYLLRGTAKIPLSPVSEAESDLKKALEISTQDGFKELNFKAHLQLGKMYYNLEEIEGEKMSSLANDHLNQARRIMNQIASHIEEPDLRKTFLNSHLSQISIDSKELVF